MPFTLGILAAILLRGLQWRFYPTTLLSQADSCMGSKSSINVCEVKNVVGTVAPPKHVLVSTSVLNTLDDLDVPCVVTLGISYGSSGSLDLL